jgi:REP element-mobilizing transposase RayT
MITDFQRKNIRMRAENYRGKRLYFVTMCFDERKGFGKSARVAAWLIEKLREAACACGFFVHAYCVMPDHVHVLAAGKNVQSDLRAFVESFKRETGFAFSKRTGRRLWQFKYYDRILRAADSADAVAWYIWLNPVRKGLCMRPTEYPFSGSFTEAGKRTLEAPMPPDWKPPWKNARGQLHPKT